MSPVTSGPRRSTAALATLIALLLTVAATAQDCIDYADYLRVAGAAATPGDAEDLARAGDLIFVADGPAGLTILRLVAGGPEFLTLLDTPGAAHAVAVENGYAYVADGPSGLQIVDVTVPEQPQFVGEFPTPS